MQKNAYLYDARVFLFYFTSITKNKEDIFGHFFELLFELLQKRGVET